MGVRRLLALVRGDGLRKVLKPMLDPAEFFGDHSASAPISRYHLDHPYVLHVDGTDHAVRVRTGRVEQRAVRRQLNWRGPIWFPINFLLVEALQKFHHYYGDDFLVECPTGSGQMMTLWEVAAELERRL